ncbi:MAG: hypothetical protein PHD82_07715 [Candidatus Riflebacteria bacterium]|nr:hypothetical protein [Candidatus Riflebacteria bacterium]
MINRRKGITLWELGLFTIFLAVAGGASVFFFFLNSSDMKKAQQKFAWVQEINDILDEVVSEISNSVQLEHPFNSSSRECFFRASSDTGNLLPSVFEEGFVFTDNSLTYVSRSPSVASGPKRLGRFANPLITNCRDGKFTRVMPDSLEIYFRADSPDGSGTTREFVRVVHLRNQ